MNRDMYESNFAILGSKIIPPQQQFTAAVLDTTETANGTSARVQIAVPDGHGGLTVDNKTPIYEIFQEVGALQADKAYPVTLVGPVKPSETSPTGYQAEACWDLEA